MLYYIELRAIYKYFTLHPTGATMKKIKNKNSGCKIKKVEITDDKISGRGGLCLFLRYLEQIQLFPLLEKFIGPLRKSSKSQKLCDVIKQIIIYFVDGSNRSISGFDELRNNESYAALLEEKKESLVGSDIVKRFFRKFIGRMHSIFRPVLHWLFVWRLGL